MQKERLVKILEDVLWERDVFERSVEEVADLLIEKGVIVSPVPIKSDLYIVHKGTPKISKAKAVGYHVSYGNYDNEEIFREWISVAHFGCIGNYSIDLKRLGKNVFFNEDEAKRYKEKVDAGCKK